MALNPRRLKFVEAYLKLGEATPAARAAGYSKQSAHAQGHRLLKTAEVRAAIDAGNAARANNAKVDAQWVISQLMGVASQPDVTQSTKVKALDLLAKHLGMYQPDRHLIGVMTPEQAKLALDAMLSAPVENDPDDEA